MGRYIMRHTLYHVFKLWYFDRCVSAFVLFFSGWFWRGHLIIKTQVKTSTQRVSVGQKWPNHGTRVEWKYKSSISWTYLCSSDFKRQAFSPCCTRVRICFQRRTCWLWRHLIARGNSIIIGGNAFARATAKPSTIKWIHLVPPEYYLTATEMENSVDWNMLFRYFDDNYYIKHTYHAWPSQMHENLLISRVKTRAIASPLINISWWVRISMSYSLYWFSQYQLVKWAIDFLSKEPVIQIDLNGKLWSLLKILF